ncbi:hypothetical protein GIB67_017058 [Kingdonia uniflora]|uniref:Disease resistance protein n=1 Tax=Kingdonia uniflora TaxID=39325 RepID=A0A7J7NCG8_9MAGN|nr:hypothetical protein GIB67_017058 [Kingdonia uniflora]
MEGAAIAVTSTKELTRCAANSIVRHISYLFCCKRNVKDLQKKVQTDLLKFEEDVKRKVNFSRDNGDVIHKVVDRWIEKVKKVQGKVVELQRQAGEIKSCCKGWCFAHYRLGKESKKKIVIVDELLIEGRHFDSVATRAPVPP